jgi:hypothetical protein
MDSNLAFTANFADVTRPTVAITAPSPGLQWIKIVFRVRGKAHDNAPTTNWTAEITMGSGERRENKSAEPPLLASPLCR